MLGVSGGQDSTLTGRLCQLAVEELRAEGRAATFVAVRLPYGVQADEQDAQIALLRLPSGPVDHGQRQAQRGRRRAEAAQGLRELLGDEPDADFPQGNIKARERMVASTPSPARRACWSPAPTTPRRR